VFPVGEQEPNASQQGGWWRRLETWQQLVSIAAGLAGVAGLFIALGVIGGSDDPDPPAGPPPADNGEIARYDGVAGHLEDGRALLDFLDQHDDETVYLEVGFPDLATGPAGGDNVGVEQFPSDGGTQYVPTSITLMTECEPGAPLPEENPTVPDGCMGTSLSLDGPVNDDSTAFFQRGVPVIKGHFQVDVTGALHMGISPINLRPLTFEQATGA
jgi:hypothetical protein